MDSIETAPLSTDSRARVAEGPTPPQQRLQNTSGNSGSSSSPLPIPRATPTMDMDKYRAMMADRAAAAAAKEVAITPAAASIAGEVEVSDDDDEFAFDTTGSKAFDSFDSDEDKDGVSSAAPTTAVLDAFGFPIAAPAEAAKTVSTTPTPSDLLQAHLRTRMEEGGSKSHARHSR